jgi:enediyne biosynthesis protein E3
MNRLLGISIDECAFSRRGFWMGDVTARNHLESAGKAFLAGYNMALEAGNDSVLEKSFNSMGAELCGFAFEGAAMAMTLLDSLMPWRRSRVLGLLHGAGRRHRYMVHVGMGWAMARLPKWLPVRTGKDNLLRWLVLDGYGFHEGYFKPRQFCTSTMPQEPRLSGYARRAFDQGLGRSLWFIHSANVQRIKNSIECFPVSRRPDLWSGVGLACTYAGGCGETTIRQLKLASDYWPELAQGAAFAAKARLEASLLVPHTILACAILCDSSPEEAARETDKALESVPENSAAETKYEVWRKNVQAAFTKPTYAKRADVKARYQMDQASA